MSSHDRNEDRNNGISASAIGPCGEAWSLRYGHNTPALNPLLAAYAGRLTGKTTSTVERVKCIIATAALRLALRPCAKRSRAGRQLRTFHARGPVNATALPALECRHERIFKVFQLSRARPNASVPQLSYGQGGTTATDMTTRRLYLRLLVASALPQATAAIGQRPTSPTIGFLSGASSASGQPFVAACRDGLRQTAFVEGDNVRIDYRWAEGRRELIARAR